MLDPSTFTPYPKNPIIGAFFREIHRVDELGSGMRKMMKYGRAYGGSDPEMIDGDVLCPYGKCHTGLPEGHADPRFEKKIQATLARVWGEETCQGETQ